MGMRAGGEVARTRLLVLTGSNFWVAVIQSLVLENIPPPTLSGIEQRWQTKVRLGSNYCFFGHWGLYFIFI